jgi:hypothetical protein
MTQETTGEAGRDQTGGSPSFCQGMMEKMMATCGPEMKEKMAGCMSKMSAMCSGSEGKEQQQG